MEKREITCIGCPVGCNLLVETESGQIIKVNGNNCQIGERYAFTELTNPVRTVTTTVLTDSLDNPVVSVRTQSDIPKSKISDCMRELKKVRLKVPVNIGDTVLENVAGTGINVVATKKII